MSAAWVEQGSATLPPASAPGRFCPPGYGYSPRALAALAPLTCDTAYVVGGLYGNPFALDALDALAATEAVAPLRIFNGDFHWFDAEPQLFADIDRRVRQHVALRGNVETELAANDAAAGCGCAYPLSVSDADVARSNAMLVRLREVAATSGGHDAATAALDSLPMFAVLQVGRLRVGVVHGDAWALAGWRFAHDALHAAVSGAQGTTPAALRLQQAFAQAAVDGFACSHTCAPALKVTAEGFVINNGAAGMANFSDTTFGLITRVSTRALPAALASRRLYGLSLRGAWVDALRLEFDAAAWLHRFDAIWPAGSPGALSYRARIANGPAYSIDHALGRDLSSCGA